MKIFYSLDEIKDIEPSMMAVGNFDGIHKGHQEVIHHAVKAAKLAGKKSSVFTFLNHPRNEIAGELVVKNIISFEEKIKIIDGLGVDYLFALPFDETMRKMQPEEFLQDLLIDKLNMEELYCGFNYRFGNKAKGDTLYLKKFTYDKHIGLDVTKAFKVDDEIVSSTLIRDLIAEGNVEHAYHCLGRFFKISGKVVEGKRFGNTIGFPTANVELDESMSRPKCGVYATHSYVSGKQYKSVTNIGNNPTVGGDHITIETHLLGFDGNLYGKDIEIEFLRFLREEKKFDSVDQLKEQIMLDCHEAINF